jgi:hypothetical protein
LGLLKETKSNLFRNSTSIAVYPTSLCLCEAWQSLFRHTGENRYPVSPFCHCEQSGTRRGILAFACPPLEGVSRSDGGGICLCEPHLTRSGNLYFVIPVKTGIQFPLSVIASKAALGVAISHLDFSYFKDSMKYIK